MATAWGHQFDGSQAFQFSNKLITTRRFVSRWNKEKFENIQSNIFLLHQQMAVIQQASPTSNKNSDIQQVENQIEFWHQVQNDYWGQKARDDFYF